MTSEAILDFLYNALNASMLTVRRKCVQTETTLTIKMILIRLNSNEHILALRSLRLIVLLTKT